jgi:hypothetical protein
LYRSDRAPSNPEGIQLPGEGNVRKTGKHVLLIADDDANCRHFFVSTLGAECHVLEANNGAQALAGSGMRVFNCSPVSDLDRVERISYDDAISL